MSNALAIPDEAETEELSEGTNAYGLHSESKPICLFPVVGVVMRTDARSDSKTWRPSSVA